MTKVFLVDDDEILLKLLSAGLQRYDLAVTAISSSKEAIRLAYSERPDLIIVDVSMPEMDGIELCRRLREMTDAPIIMLSAVSDEDSIIAGLHSGADDYVTKPYSLAELVARIRAQLRIRTYSGTIEDEATLTAGDVSIEVQRRKVLVRGEEIALTPIEFTLLLCLVRNKNKVVDHRQLLTEAWGPEYVDQLEYVRLYIRYLRQKIEENPNRPQIIKTERGIGYYIVS
jgi:two-component system, OmpR family, KDP operon response regulator KdpE